MKNLELMVTLWPSFPHFARFAEDERLKGIRLNSAMVNKNTLANELEIAKKIEDKVPLYFDIKGRQLRVLKALPYKDHLELILNHPIEVETPTMVLFKAGADQALLKEIKNKRHLIFQGGPNYNVEEGESLHIRNPSLVIKGPLFCDYEIGRMEKAKAVGFNKYFLSYVECARDIDEFRNHIGKDAEVVAKIENKKGLKYVAEEFKKAPNYSLLLARGDLYVEVDKPMDILNATKLLIEKDPEAAVGSRMLLTLINQSVPECSDLNELAWMYDIGYRRFLLCDGLCLKEEPLSRAVNAFEH